MCALSMPSRTKLMRRQCFSVGRMRGLFVPVSQRNFSSAPIRFMEQKSKHEGIMTKLKKIFRQSEIKSQEAELGSMYRCRLKKLRNEIRITREMTNHKILNNNVLVNYYYSYLKYIRLEKIIADYKLRVDILSGTNSFLSLASFRSVMELAPYNSKPPIREPNMPEQREKKEDKKEKKKKKPVIRVDEKTTQDLEKNDTIWRHEDDHYSYKWGIKLEDDSSAEIIPEDVPHYETKKSWGVKLPQLPAETKDVLPSKEDIQNGIASKKKEPLQMSEAKTEEPENPKLFKKIADPSPKTKEPEVLKNESDILSLKSVKETSKSKNKDLVNKSQEESLKLSSCEDTGEGDYNIPKELPHDGEITAWKEVVERSKLQVDEEPEPETVSHHQEKVFIRPEPPEPKLDVQAVRSIDHVPKQEGNQKNKEREENTKQKGIRALDLKKLTLLKPKPDGYISKKKIHFDSHSCVPLPRSDRDSLTSEKALTKEINKIVGSSNFENTNPIIKKFKDVKRNLLKAFFNKDTLAETDISTSGETSDKSEKVSNRNEASTEMTKPLLKTKAKTLPKINSKDMSYNDAELDKKLDEISCQKMENTLTSVDDIGDNKNELFPAKSSICDEPCSNKKEVGVNRIPLLHTSYLENIPGFSFKDNLFRKGSSETRNPKTFLSSLDDYADAVGEHILKEGNIRVPKYPHHLMDNLLKTAENQCDEKLRNCDRYSSYTTKEERMESGHGKMEAGNLVKFYEWSIKMAIERERLEEEMNRDGRSDRDINTGKNAKMAKVEEICKKTEMAENAEDSEVRRWQLAGNTDNSRHTAIMETTILNTKSNPEMSGKTSCLYEELKNLETRTASGQQNQIVDEDLEIQRMDFSKEQAICDKGLTTFKRLFVSSSLDDHLIPACLRTKVERKKISEKTDDHQL